jgi:hypothetical protein
LQKHAFPIVQLIGYQFFKINAHFVLGGGAVVAFLAVADAGVEPH